MLIYYITALHNNVTLIVYYVTLYPYSYKFIDFWINNIVWELSYFKIYTLTDKSEFPVDFLELNYQDS